MSETELVDNKASMCHVSFEKKELKTAILQHLQPVFAYADLTVAPLRAGLESGYLKTHELC